MVSKQEKWHRRYILLAEHVAQWSEDQGTKVGAVIVGPDNRVVSLGYNGFPSGVVDLPERHERPLKYEFTEHAERNAIHNAKLIPEGSKLYMNYDPCPCAECTKAVIQNGLVEIIGPDRPFPGKGAGTHYHVDKDSPAAAMLREAGVRQTVIGDIHDNTDANQD